MTGDAGRYGHPTSDPFSVAPMKSPLVHKFMRRHYLPFLFEHGLERPMAPTTGVTCTNHAGLHLRMGYVLGVGYYDWTGNTISLLGTVSKLGIVHRSLLADGVQPECLLPDGLREALRELAVRKLSLIAATGQHRDPAAPRYVNCPGEILKPLRSAREHATHLPDFRYQGEDDLKRWCATVRPFIPACLATLKAEAERLGGDRNPPRG
jgi:hypothetical protein